MSKTSSNHVTSNTFDVNKAQRYLEQGCLELGFQLQDEQLMTLLSYVELFMKWNSTYNLSAIRDLDGMLRKHILDSLTIVQPLQTFGLDILSAKKKLETPSAQDHTSLHIIDVGTGGGLPGVVLAICFPEHHFSLLDSAGKKMRFLFQVKTALQLDNVTLINNRIDAYQPQSRYDIVISRAFSSLCNFTQWCQHLLSAHGQFWAMKGVFPDEELSQMQKHYIVIEHRPLQVPGLNDERCLLRIKHSDS